jgi:putative chitinase
MNIQNLLATNNPQPFEALNTNKELCLDIQQALQNEGLLAVVDGVYGSLTENALSKFKSNHKLSGGAYIGKTTANYLQRALSHGRPYLVTLEQASKVYGCQLYPFELADLNNSLIRFGITTVEDIKMFLVQTAHESGGLKWLKELSDGSQYEGRTDLGNTVPGYGRKYKGAGCLQLTGFYNYEKFSRYIMDTKVLTKGCDYVAEIYPFCSAGFWWMNNGISKAVGNNVDIYGITRMINGGLNGIDDRIRYYNIAKDIIK